MQTGTTRKGSNRRREILDTAGHWLMNVGYDGWSMRELATSLGMTLSNLQYYFPSKDALVVDSFVESLDALQVHIKGFRPEGKTNPTILFELALLTLDDFRGRFGALFLMISSLALHKDVFAGLAQRSHRRFIETARLSVSKVENTLDQVRLENAAAMIAANFIGHLYFIHVMAPDDYLAQREAFAATLADHAGLLLLGVTAVDR